MPDPIADPIWLTEADVVELIDLPAAIDAIEAGLRDEASGATRNMEKTHVLWGDGHTLHAIGAVNEARGLVATKTWAHAGGASPVVVIWDAESGALAAIIEAFALGQLRTGAMSGVATRRLARDDAASLAIIGTGKQAAAQVAAVASVRALTRISVHSPTLDHREAFASSLRGACPDIEVGVADDVAAAIAEADIVTTVTRAREPFLDSSMVKPGTHINAIGAITPERAELAADVVGRAGVIAVDSLDAARRLARELEGVADLVPLSVVDRASRGADDLTIFKAMGVGLADLSLGASVLERAREVGRGRAVPAPVRVPPRLWSDE